VIRLKSKKDALTDKDSNLIKAMQMFEKDWIATYPDELKLAGKFTYSEIHNKRMKRILNNDNSWFYRVTSTHKRRIAVAVITVLVVFNTAMITNAEARLFVSNFFVKVYENCSDILFPNDAAPSEIVDYFKPAYIPKGYHVESIEDMEIEFWIDYTDHNGAIISFIQATLDGADLGIDTENSKLESITINNTEGVIVYNKGRYLLSWSDGEYRYHLMGDDKAEIIKMAESIKIFDKK